MNYYALYLSYHPSSQNGSVYSLLTGWTIMTGRLFGPKMEMWQ